MDALVVEQVWATLMFILGSLILNTCSKWERKEQAVAEDTRNRYGKRKSDMVKPKTLRGSIMTFLGAGLCLGGMILFMIHV